MDEYEAVFEIDSTTDAYAARRIVERAYDTVREESRSTRAGADSGEAVIEAFDRLQEEVKPPAPGRLTITLERDDGGFDEE